MDKARTEDPVKPKGPSLSDYLLEINKDVTTKVPHASKAFKETEKVHDPSQSRDFNPVPYKGYIKNIDSDDPNLDIKRAEGQGFGEELGHSLAQFGLGALGGFISSAGTSTDIAQSVNTIMGTEKEYGNMLSDFGKSITQYSKDNFPIYQKDPQGKFNPTDSAYWLNMFGETGNSAGIMAYSAVEAAAITTLTEGAGLGAEIANIGSKLRNAKSLKALMSVGNEADKLRRAGTLFAVFGRQNESIMEAGDTFHDEKAKLMAKGFNLQQAEEAAAKAAHATYLGNLPLMALDILQFRAMTFNPISGASAGGLVENILDKIPNKTLGKAVGAAVGIGSESAEEFWQYLVSEESKNYAEVASGIGSGKNFQERFKEYSDKGEIWNSAIAGAMGGVVLGGISKGLEHFMSGASRKNLDKKYSDFVNSITGIGLEMSDQIRKSEEDGDDIKANNIRRSMGIHKALHATHLDNLKDSDTAFNTYTSYLKDMLDAVNSGDTELIKKFGIEGNEQHVKDNVPHYLSDAQKIKDIYDDVKMNNTRDAVIPIAYNRFLVDNLATQLNTIKANIGVTEASIPDLSNVSSIGKQIHDTKLDISIWEQEGKKNEQRLKSSDLSEAERKSLEGAQEQLKIQLNFLKNKLEQQNSVSEEHSAITDEDILKSVQGNNKLITLREQAIGIQNALNNHRKQLNIWADPKFQSKNKKGKLYEIIIQAKTTGELESVEKNLVREGILTDELKQKINSKKKELSAIEETEALKNKQENNTISPTKSPLSSAVADANNTTPIAVPEPQTLVQETNSVNISPDRAELVSAFFPKGNESQGNIPSPIGKTGTADNATVIVEDDLLDEKFDPSPLSDNLTDKQKDNIKTKIGEYHTSLSNDLGRKASAKELVEDLINHSSAAQVEKNFNVVKLGWELNEFSKVDFEKIYEELFGSRKSKAQEFLEMAAEATLTEEEYKNQQAESSKKLEQSQAPAIQTKETATGDKVFIHVDPFRTVESTLKFAHLSVPYNRKMQDNSKGETEISYEHQSDELNQGEYVDSKELMNPNLYHPGTKLDVKVAEAADSMLIAQWSKDFEKLAPMPFGKWAEGKDKNSDEYIGRMPMIIHNANGKGVAFVHDIEWYNPSNIGMGESPEVQAQIIADAKAELLTFRKAVLANNGNLSITITEKRPGTKFVIEGKSLITVAEANPQAMIGFATDSGNISVGNKTIMFEDLINKQELKRGYKYDLRQVGITPEGKPQYFASPLHYDVLDEEAQMSVVQAMMVYLAQHDKGENLYSADKVKTIREGILKETGLDLFDQADLEKYLNLFMGTLAVSGKSNKQIADYVESNPEIAPLSPYVVMSEGRLVFGIKGVKLSPKAENGFTLFTHPNNLTKDNASVLATMMTSIAQRISRPDFLGKMTQNLKKKNLADNTKVALIQYNKADGTMSVKPVGTYQEYLKSKLKTNLKSFDLGDGTFATFVQPVIHYTYENKPSKVIASTSTGEQKSIAQVVAESASKVTGNPVNENVALIGQITKDLDKYADLGLSSEVLDILKNLGKEGDTQHDPSYESLTDDIVKSVKSKITKISDLDTTDRKTIVQFVANEIMSQIDPKSKTGINKNALINHIVKSFSAIIAPKLALVEEKIPILTEMYNSGEFPVLAPVLEDFIRIKNNADIIKNNWNFLINEAFEDYIEKFTGISAKMSKDQTNIDVQFKNEDVDLVELEEDTQEFELELGDQTEKNYSKESVEDDGKKSISYLLKRFLSSIPEFDAQGNPKQGFMGIPRYPGFDEYYNAIGKILSSPSTVNSDYKDILIRLEEHAKSKRWVRELINRLEASDDQLKNAFMYNFNRDTLSMKFVMYTYNSRSQKYELKVYDTNANEILRVIQNGWKENFKKPNGLVLLNGEDYVINTVKAKEAFDEFNTWVAEKRTATEEEAQNWLSKFGIDLSDAAIHELAIEGYRVVENGVSKKYEFKGMFNKSSATNGIFGLLARKLEIMLHPGINLNYEENDVINPFTDVNGVLKKIADIESKHNKHITTNSFRDNGKSIFGYTPSKFATSFVSKLKLDAQLRADKFKISFDQGSYLLKLIEENDQFRDRFSIDHIGNTAFKELGKSVFGKNDITSLSDADHEVTKLGLFQGANQGKVEGNLEGIELRIARMFFPTMSDKSTMLDLTTAVLELKNKDFDLTGESVLMSDSLKKVLFSQLVEPELKRIISHHAKALSTGVNPNELVNQKGYNRAAQIFNFIPALNNLMYTQENGEQIRLIEFLAATSDKISPEVYDKIVSKIKDDTYSVLDQLVNKLTNDKLAIWDTPVSTKNEDGKVSEVKINTLLDTTYLDSKQGTKEEKVKVAALDYVINSMLTNANIHMLIAGDIANYSQDKAFTKKDSEGNYVNFINANPTTPINNEIYATIFSDVIGVNLGKRLAMLIAPGATIAQSKDDRYIQLFLKDRVSMSQNIEFLISLYHGEQAAEYSKELLEQAKSDPKAIKQLQEMFPDLNAYFEIESTDAQEYTTAKEHLDVMFRQGRVDEGLYLSLRKKLELHSQAEKKGLSIPEAALFTKEELRTVFQPIKPVVTGQMNDVANDVSRMVYIKSSSFPLLPQVTMAFPGLNKLRNKMEELQERQGKNVRASYDTANKVGAVLAKNQIQVWDNDGNFIEDSLDVDSIDQAINEGRDTSALVMNREFFRIQQDVPFKSDKHDEMDTNILGTQMMKLMFGNGISQIKDKIFDYNGEKVSGEQLHEIYSNLFHQWISGEKTKLYNSLGIDEATGKAIDKAKTVQKLQNILQQEAKKRGYPRQDIEALKLDNDGNLENSVQFTVPLWLSPNSNRYEALLNAIVTNRLLTLKLPGASFVAASEEGFRTIEFGNNYSYSRYSPNGYEVSSQGDSRFSALSARLKDGRTIEEAYQLDVKGYRTKGNDWKLGKGKPPLISMTQDQSYEAYKALWKQWASENTNLMKDLAQKSNGKTLTDKFASTPISQARALSEILNEDFATGGQVDQSDVIFTEGWTGELKGTRNEDGSIKTAQVLVSSKLRGKDGKLLDLLSKNENGEYIYVTQKDNGSYFLKEDMIDKSLLSVSSFRIPTSSHVSMSQIEIVGFLPLSAGDLMIVPKNFTKQKGLDFDVDKENTYWMHHFVDEDGKISPLDTITSLEDYDELVKDIDARLKQFRENKAIWKQIQQYEDEVEVLSKMEVDAVDARKFIEKLSKKVNPEYTQEELKQLVTYKELLKDGKVKLIQNEVIKVYSSVLGNGDERIQQRINKILSTDFAEKQADIISGLVSANVDNSMFTVLSDEYNKSKMALGAAGKLGIGVYSNVVVLHSLIQQSSKPIQLMQTVFDEEGKKDRIGYELKIGGVETQGFLGRPTSLDGGRYLTDVLQERQSTGTDNEKLQIMGKVHINEETINVDTVLTLLGFDKGKATVNGKEEEMSIPYLLLSQPIIREYVSIIKNAKSTVAEYNANSKSDALLKLLKKYNPESIALDEQGTLKEREKLTAQKLVDNVIDNGTDGINQQAVLELFLELQAYGDAITSLQKKLNIQRSGLGKSMFEMVEKYENVSKLQSSELIDNVSSLIGDYISGKDYIESDKDALAAEGYINFPEFELAVKPTTITGSLLTAATKTGYELFSDFFPFQNPTISKVINEVIGILGKQDNENKKLELQHEIFQEIKKYLYSSDKLGIFKGDPQQERTRLFFDKGDNTSLSSYIKQIKNQNEFINTNKLISRFQLTTEKGILPSLIKFDNSKSEDFNEEYKYLALVELMDKNLPLPDYNGQPYDTRKLAKDLITYAYLEGGIQEAIQYVKYIPIAYLKEMGFADVTKEWQRAAGGKVFDGLWGKMLGTTITATVPSRFAIQYIQHNANKLPKLTPSNMSKTEFAPSGRLLSDVSSFEPKDINPEDIKDFVAIYNKSAKKGLSKFQIYQFDGMRYNRISNLGIFGMSEYSIKSDDVVPLIDKHFPSVPVSISSTPVVSNQPVAQSQAVFSLGDKNLTKTLTEISEAGIPGISDMTKLLMPFIDNSTTIEIGETKGNGAYKVSQNKIIISDKLVANTSISNNQIAQTILHEFVHSITTKRLSEYYNKDGSLKQGLDINNLPSDIQRLHRLFKEVEKTLGTQLDEFKQWYSAGNQGKIRPTDDRILYAGMDIFEFSAMIMSEPDIQKRMSEIPYMATNKTLLEQFAEAIKKVLAAIGVEFGEDNVTTQAFNAIFEVAQNKKASDEASSANISPLAAFGFRNIDEEIETTLNGEDAKDAANEDEDFSDPNQELNEDCIF